MEKRRNTIECVIEARTEDKVIKARIEFNVRAERGLKRAISEVVHLPPEDNFRHRSKCKTRANFTGSVPRWNVDLIKLVLIYFLKSLA